MSTSIRLPEHIERRLDFLARHTGRAKAFYIREMIMEKIDDIEDYYLSEEILERAQEVNQSKREADEVIIDLDQED